MQKSEDTKQHKALVKAGTASLQKASSRLIRRGMAEVEQLLQGLELKQKKGILILGRELCEVLVTLLVSRGYEAESIWSDFPYTKHSERIFSALSSGRYDLALVAYWGFFEVLLEIRERFPSVRTIFLNSNTEELEVTALQRGVDAVLSVPFKCEELMDTIERMIPSQSPPAP